MNGKTYRIKPLEWKWKTPDRKVWVVQTLFGTWEIWPSRTGTYQLVPLGDECGEHYPSLQSAKDEVDQLYLTRLLPVLEEV
jgi:hypothetical protein